MGNAHRFTTFQIVTLLIVSAAVGACFTLMVVRGTSARADAAVAPVEQQSGETAAKTKEKKKAGKPVVHFEIGCRDAAKTSEFYSKLFDWNIHTEGMAGTILTGSKKGIEGHITALGHEPQNYVTVYVEVEDIQSYLDKATALGGKTAVPPVKIPTGKFAWFTDPDGNIVALIQRKKP